MFPSVRAGLAEISLSDDEASSQVTGSDHMVQLNIEQSLMRGALGSACTASSCTNQAKAAASGLKRKRDTYASNPLCQP